MKKTTNNNTLSRPHWSQWVGAVCLLSILAGCTNRSAVATKENPKIVRVAYVSAPSELVHRGAEEFAERLRKKSDGKLEARLYPSGQLGDDRELTEGLQLGSIDIVLTGSAIVGWYTPEYGVIDAPFVWRDYQHVDSVWKGEIGEELRLAMKKKNGVDLRHLWYRGPRYLTSTNQKIHHPDDLEGFKLRVPELEVYVKSWQAFGANTTPIPFTDMFMALKLGVVDGQENPLATIYGNNLHEVQNYIMETKHLISFYLFCVGPYFQKRFTQEEQEIINQTAEEATGWHNEEVESSEKRYRQLLEEAGVEFVGVDRPAFRKRAVETIPPKFSETWLPGLYERILKSD
jgi:tripartite ATP-independent transporter DctP family solute receptor